MHISQQQLTAALQLAACDDTHAWSCQYYSRVLAEEIAKQTHDYPVLDYEYKDRDILYRNSHEAVVLQSPMDFFEFGVFQGESFRKWLEINTHPQSRFFGFDSFEGLPEAWRSNNLPKGHFCTGGAVPDICDPRAAFIKGFFNESLRPFLDDYEPQNRMVIHIDSDLCSSCLFALMTMDPFIRRGTLIVFDDFGPADEFAAFHHYVKACGREWRIVAARRDFVKFAVVITK